jgi:hypothetical protein
MVVKTKCRKCGVTIRLDFGDMTKEQALTRAEEMDQSPRECPGQHVELSGWNRRWGLADAIHRAYDLGEGGEPEPVTTDREYVEGLLAQGKAIVDGGANRVPELSLPGIHDFQGLEHLGFGNFASDTHLFLRCDSPRTTRFYEKVERST